MFQAASFLFYCPFSRWSTWRGKKKRAERRKKKWNKDGGCYITLTKQPIMVGGVSNRVATQCCRAEPRLLPSLWGIFRDETWNSLGFRSYFCSSICCSSPKQRRSSGEKPAGEMWPPHVCKCLSLRLHVGALRTEPAHPGVISIRPIFSSPDRNKFKKKLQNAAKKTPVRRSACAAASRLEEIGPAGLFWLAGEEARSQRRTVELASAPEDRMCKIRQKTWSLSASLNYSAGSERSRQQSSDLAACTRCETWTPGII